MGKSEREDTAALYIRAGGAEKGKHTLSQVCELRDGCGIERWLWHREIACRVSDSPAIQFEQAKHS